jgi:hypothetical protein
MTRKSKTSDAKKVTGDGRVDCRVDVPGAGVSRDNVASFNCRLIQNNDLHVWFLRRLDLICVGNSNVPNFRELRTNNQFAIENPIAPCRNGLLLNHAAHLVASGGRIFF